MPQAVDEAGNIWETDGQGRATRFVGRQGGRQQQPTVTQLPPTPRQTREDARKDREEGRDNTRTDLSVSGEERSGRKEGFDNAKDLRNEFTKLPDVQDYRQAIKAYTTALKTASNPAGDLNLIYSFAKIMDPGSVVREGEQAAVAGGDSVYGQTVARLKKELDNGGSFRPEYRKQLRQELHTRLAEMNDAYNGQRIQYQDYARELGVDPKIVIGHHDGGRFLNDIQSYYEGRNAGKGAPGGKGGKPVPAGLTGTVTDTRPNPKPQAAPAPGGFGQSHLGQSMSGVNEGIANTFGLPMDVMTGAMNLVPKGINAAADTNIPTIEKPFLGSEWIKDQMDGWAIRPKSADSGKQFARRVGQSVGSAAVPLLGTYSSIPRLGAGLLGAAGGGVGGAAAQQAYPGNPVAEFVGELAGGGVTGLGLAGAARRGAQRQIESHIPTVEQLKGQAGELYRQAESRGVTADPTMTQDLADKLRASLADDGRVSPTGRISEVYPKAREAMQLADDYAGQNMNPTQMQTVRGVMGDGLNSADATERRTARRLTDAFDDWANPQAPELAQARNVSSRYLNAQQLERARELAAVRAGQFTGSGFENALRTEYRGIDRNAVKGNGRYGTDLNNAIQDVSRGTPMSNFARDVGRYAPTGPVSSGLGAGGAFIAGNALGGPGLGAALGATVAGAGHLGRMGATRMGMRNADIAEMTARNGGAIPQAPLLDPEMERTVAAILTAQQASLLNSAPRRKKDRK